MKIIRERSDNNICYKEYYDDSNNVIVEMKMTFNLSNYKDRQELNKAWKKDKSPLLSDLNKEYRKHLNNMKSDKDVNWYKPLDD